MKYYPGDTVRDINNGVLLKIIKYVGPGYTVKQLYARHPEYLNKTAYLLPGEFNLVHRPFLNHIKDVFDKLITSI